MDEILEAVILGGAGDDDIELAILHNLNIDHQEIGNERAPFDINGLTDEEVVLHFRFRREDLPMLLNVFHVPNVIVTDTRNRIDGTTELNILSSVLGTHFVLGFTALLIVLKRMAYPCRLGDLQSFFNLSSQSLSQIIKTTMNIMLMEKGNLLDNLNNLTWLNREKMRVYAETIHNKGGAIDNCWGFIDGTTRGICRPSVAQEEYYSGHKKFHCLKYQSVICPDGVIASFIGAYPGRRHDAAIFRESNLYFQLEEKAVFDDNNKFVIYGDQGYGLLELLITPFAGAPDNMPLQHFQFNQSMKVLRVAVEWGFSKIVSLWAFIDFKKNQKLLLQDLELFCKVAVLLTNAHTCLYGHQAATYFNVAPPTLEQYFGE